MAFEGARDRWERMAPRERALVALLGVTFIVCIVGWIGMTVSSGLTAIEKRNKTTREALAALEKHRAGGGHKTAAAKVVIPATPLELSTYLDEIIRQIKAESPAYPSPKLTEHGKYTESAMRITLRDLSIGQLKDLLEQIETKSGVIQVRELKVKRNFRDKEKLDVELSVATWYEPGAAKPEAKADEQPAVAKEAD